IAAAPAQSRPARAGARRSSLHQRLRLDLAGGQAGAKHHNPSRNTGKYMNRKGDKSLIVGLDIGTSKVTALVGEYSPGYEIEVIGIGSPTQRGVKPGRG